MNNSLFLKIIFTLFSFVFILLFEGLYFSSRVEVSFLIILLLSINEIFTDKYPVSLKKIFFIFCYLFFGIGGFYQFKTGSTYFGAPELTEPDFFFTNVTIILIQLLYLFFYAFFFSRKIGSKFLNRINGLSYLSKKVNRYQILLLTTLSVTAFLLVLYLNNFNIVSMLIRSGDAKEQIEVSGSFRLIIRVFFQPIPVFCFIIYFLSKDRSYWVLFFLGVIALLTANPIAMARFSAAALYIPVCLVIFEFLHRKNIFSMVFLGGMVIIFPLLGNLRYITDATTVSLKFNLQTFNTGAFDSYQSLALVLSNDLVTYGNQLLGVFFFWIPRAIWPSKPIGSGAFMAEKLHFIFPNVSANFFAEGFLNFGFLGILLFIIIISYLTARFDKAFWSYVNKVKNNYFILVYYLSIGLFFFVLRGDLLSSFAYSTSMILSAIFSVKISKRK